MSWYYSKWVYHCFSLHYLKAILSVWNTNSLQALDILFLSLAVEKLPSVEERLFIPRPIFKFSHPRGSEGLFVLKDICTALQQFLPWFLHAEVTSHDSILKSGWWLALTMKLQSIQIFFKQSYECKNYYSFQPHVQNPAWSHSRLAHMVWQKANVPECVSLATQASSGKPCNPSSF